MPNAMPIRNMVAKIQRGISGIGADNCRSHNGYPSVNKPANIALMESFIVMAHPVENGSEEATW
jgi:hypothetical protein